MNPFPFTPKPNRTPKIQVFGPAYLDRILLVDRPLIDNGLSPPLDQSHEGRWTVGTGLSVADPDGNTIVVEPPNDWPGPYGRIDLTSPLSERGWTDPRGVVGLSWHDDLGGMGAGYAAALGGSLVSALGPLDDPSSGSIEKHLSSQGIEHKAIRIPEVQADTTLLITSGRFGDKLPIGFRGCHARIESLRPFVEAVDLRVVAGLPNRLSAEVLRAPDASLTFFAPALRNMTDRDLSVVEFAADIDILSCNRREWESLEGREEVAWQVAILIVTNGAKGAKVRYTTEDGEGRMLSVPAFRRTSPPVDTNRAGEAFGSRFVATLLEHDWNGETASPFLICEAALKASAAAALELDLERFGFPGRASVEKALEVGIVGEPDVGKSSRPWL